MCTRTHVRYVSFLLWSALSFGLGEFILHTSVLGGNQHIKRTLMQPYTVHHIKTALMGEGDQCTFSNWSCGGRGEKRDKGTENSGKLPIYSVEYKTQILLKLNKNYN